MSVRDRMWMVCSAACLLAGCGRVPEEAKPVADPGPAKIEPAHTEPAPSQLPAAEPARALAPDPILAASQTVPASNQQDVPIQAELRIAMEELADALRARDATTVLAKFSRQKGFRFVDTRRPKPASVLIMYARLERELTEKKGDLYDALFGPSGVVQYVSGEHALPWPAVASDELVPRHVDPKQVWLRFRFEGDAWLVDTLGYPATVRGR